MCKIPYLSEYKIVFKVIYSQIRFLYRLFFLFYGLLYGKDRKAIIWMFSYTLCKQQDSVVVALSLYIWSDKFETKSFSLDCKSFYTIEYGSWQVHFTIEYFFAVLSWIVEVQAIYGFLYRSCRSSYAVPKTGVGNKYIVKCVSRFQGNLKCLACEQWMRLCSYAMHKNIV